jgi:hypothetical protein
VKYILELEATPSMGMGILPPHKNTTKIQHPTFYNNFKFNRKGKKRKMLGFHRTHLLMHLHHPLFHKISWRQTGA